VCDAHLFSFLLTDWNVVHVQIGHQDRYGSKGGWYRLLHDGTINRKSIFGSKAILTGLYLSPCSCPCPSEALHASVTDGWAWVDDMPTSRYGHSMLSTLSYHFIFGGYDGTGALITTSRVCSFSSLFLLFFTSACRHFVTGYPNRKPHQLQL
jgi:hypothetical protein